MKDSAERQNLTGKIFLNIKTNSTIMNTFRKATNKGKFPDILKKTHEGGQKT